MSEFSFANNVPQPSREQETMKAEIVDVLTELDYVVDPAELSAEDVQAIGSRAELLRASHVNSDTAIALAYIDRKANQEVMAGNSPDVVVSKVTPEIVSGIVSPDLASNAEFVGTVLAKAKAHFAEGTYRAFSDALIAAVGARESAFSSTPGIEGKIDGQDNVVQPADEQLLH